MRLAIIALLTIFNPFACKAETQEQACIRHLIDAAPDGFVELRGTAYRQVKNVWEAVTMPVGAETCMVDWTDANEHAELDCIMLSTPDRTAADREFLRLRDVVASVVPDWKDARRAPPAEDSFRIFFEPHPDGENVRRTIVLRYRKSDTGKYHVDMQFSAPITPALARKTALENEREMAVWVAEDVRDFIAAAASGFESYKRGDPTSGSYGPVWACSRKPLAAEQCLIRQLGRQNWYLCVLFRSAWKGELRMQYERLVANVNAALPTGWSSQNRDEAALYDSPTTGMSGRIWIDHDSATETFAINFEIFSKNVR